MMELEESIYLFYRDLAGRFTGKGYLQEFLEALAEDEKEHVEILSRVCARLNQEDRFEPDLTVEASDLTRILKPLHQARTRFERELPSKKELFHCILSVEFSEWNDIFSYIVSTLIQRDKSFLRELEKIQRHRVRIEQFFESIPEGKIFLEKFRGLPKAWTEKILIVEDNLTVAELLKVVLERIAPVDIAENGEEGLKKLSEHYYRVIVSDVDMPILGGIEFYERGAELYPDISERFLFFTGDSSAERLAFFTGNNLRYCIKPARFQVIRDTVLEMMNLAPEGGTRP
jgi:CheY-like chemotaxis protein